MFDRTNRKIHNNVTGRVVGSRRVMSVLLDDGTLVDVPGDMVRGEVEFTCSDILGGRLFGFDPDSLKPIHTLTQALASADLDLDSDPRHCREELLL